MGKLLWLIGEERAGSRGEGNGRGLMVGERVGSRGKARVASQY